MVNLNGPVQLSENSLSHSSGSHSSKVSDELSLEGEETAAGGIGESGPRRDLEGRGCGTVEDSFCCVEEG